MNLGTIVFAMIAGLVHVAIFALESLLFRHPAVRGPSVGDRHAPGGGHVGVQPGVLQPVPGRWGVPGRGAGFDALTLYACAFMVAAAVVLVVSQRRLWARAVLQGGAPLVALLLAAL